MTIKQSFSFLTYPGRHRPDDPIAPGTMIPNDGSKLAKMLADIFANASRDCHIPIIFASEGDTQENPVRSELVALAKKPSMAAVAVLARRLQLATSGTSGMGLLFVSVGDDAGSTRIVISRFPADEGVVAERAAGKLTLEFVEQVFLKSAHSYKAATYGYSSRPNDLWDGHAVDRQLNHGSRVMADYWIVDFLKSDLKTTAAAGTKRLAMALRAAVESTSEIGAKREITSAVQLASNMTHRAMTIADFCEQFHFSPLPGEMSLHDVYMIHGAKANRSHKRRTGVALRYMPATSVFERDLKPADGKTGVAVHFATPLWLVRGSDRIGRNDFEIGHKP